MTVFIPAILPAMNTNNEDDVKPDLVGGVTSRLRTEDYGADDETTSTMFGFIVNQIPIPNQMLSGYHATDGEEVTESRRIHVNARRPRLCRFCPNIFSQSIYVGISSRGFQTHFVA